MSRRTTILALAIALLAGRLASCSTAMEKGSVNPGCTSDRDCEDGYVCDHDSGSCVPNLDKDLLVEVSPFDADRGSGYLPTQFFERHVDMFDADINVDLLRPILVQGTVQRTPRDEDGGIDARIEFQPVETVFPRTLRSPVSTSTTTDTSGNAGRYEVSLLPGAYDVLIYPASPENETYPPLYPERLAVDSEGTSDQIFNYDELKTLEGTLHLADEMPVPHGLLVWVADSASGRRVSTAATTGTDTSTDCTDECAGTFSLVLSDSAGNVELRVTPEDTAQAAGYPSLSFGPWSVAELDADGNGAIDLDRDLDEPLVLPVLGSLVIYKAKVEGLTSAGVSEPVAEVSVRFTAERDGAKFETYGVTNGAGEICTENSDGELVWGVMLRENDYEVTINPPEGGTFESLVVPVVRVTYSGDGTLMGQVFELGVKPPFTGRAVLALTGEPLEGLTAEAHPVRAVTTGGEGQPLPRFGTDLTGYDGLLSLDLDRGVYDILVRGGPSDGVAWLWVQGVEPGNPDPWELEMERPLILTGILTEDAVPVADALIRVCEVTYSPLIDEPPDLRLVWETTSSASGIYEVYLSPDD